MTRMIKIIPQSDKTFHQKVKKYIDKVKIVSLGKRFKKSIMRAHRVFFNLFILK